MAADHPYLDHQGPIGFAHRGGAGSWPENTMVAFEQAVARGFRYVETDVHVTADGVLVAFHDDRLDRVTDRSGVVAELRWSEVSSARVDGREPIPRFEELLTTFPELRVNIDPKSDAAVEPLIDLLRRHAALDRVCVGSFSDRRLGAMHEAFGDAVCLSAGPLETLRMFLRSWGLPSGRHRARIAQVPPTHRGVRIVSDRFVARMHDRGVHVHVWTIDDADHMHQLLDLGVDGIMTDDLDSLVEVYRSRGLWS